MNNEKDNRKRCILHVDMDAFFASVEQRDHPEWRGKPVIVGAPPDQRGVVSTCSYEARTFGIHSAMPSREAYRLCPQGIFVQGGYHRYQAVSDQVFSIFNRFTPFIEAVSIDEAFLDVTGSRALFGDGRAIATAIRKAIADEVRITASVGVASNKFLAKMASEAAKPDGLFVVPDDDLGMLRFLGGLKIGALWGVGKVTEAILLRAGFPHVSDVQKTAPDKLRRLLGDSLAEHLLNLAFGQDESEILTESEEKSISKETTFLEDCTDRAHIRETLKELCGQVGFRVRERGFYAGIGRLKLRWKDFKTITRQAPFAVPSCDDFAFRELAFRLFDAEPLVQAVRLIGFGVSGLVTERVEQLSFFDTSSADRDKRERLCRVVDRLREKLKEMKPK